MDERTPRPPRSIPAGMHVEMSRARVRPGESATVDEWMAMLNERHDECVATLDRERMAVEIVFRHIDGDGTEWMYWVMVRGDGASVESSEHALDRDHIEYSKRCLEPGWEDATPQLLLMPAAIGSLVTAFARG